MKNTTSFKVFSPAKINLSLNIIKLRDDDYHDIDSIMAKISFYDTLTFTKKKEGIEIKVFGKYKIPTNHENLVYKAAYLLSKKSKKKCGIKIEIEKNIPVGGGLGGGSSNAAETLKFLNTFWDINLCNEDLCNIGKQIGSEILFFLKDSLVARVKGRGDFVDAYDSINLFKKYDSNLSDLLDLDRNNIYKLLLLLNTKILLVSPKISISTKWAYKKIREYYNLKYPQLKGLANTFEKPIFEKYNDLKKIKELMIEHGAVHALMSGSGSTIYGFFKSGIDQIENNFKEFGDTIVCEIKK